MVSQRTSLSALVALLIGLPFGWILAMALTPALWRLEPILHMELAGHSGPSDWVFYVVWAVVIPTWYALVRFVLFRGRTNTS